MIMFQCVHCSNEAEKTNKDTPYCSECGGCICLRCTLTTDNQGNVLHILKEQLGECLDRAIKQGVANIAKRKTKRMWAAVVEYKNSEDVPYLPVCVGEDKVETRRLAEDILRDRYAETGEEILMWRVDVLQ